LRQPTIPFERRARATLQRPILPFYRHAQPCYSQRHATASSPFSPEGKFRHPAAASRAVHVLSSRRNMSACEERHAEGEESEPQISEEQRHTSITGWNS